MEICDNCLEEMDTDNPEEYCLGCGYCIECCDAFFYCQDRE